MKMTAQKNVNSRLLFSCDDSLPGYVRLHNFPKWLCKGALKGRSVVIAVKGRWVAAMHARINGARNTRAVNLQSLARSTSRSFSECLYFLQYMELISYRATVQWAHNLLKFKSGINVLEEGSKGKIMIALLHLLIILSTHSVGLFT